EGGRPADVGLGTGREGQAGDPVLRDPTGRRVGAVALVLGGGRVGDELVGLRQRRQLGVGLGGEGMHAGTPGRVQPPDGPRAAGSGRPSVAARWIEVAVELSGTTSVTCSGRKPGQAGSGPAPVGASRSRKEACQPGLRAGIRRASRNLAGSRAGRYRSASVSATLSRPGPVPVLRIGSPAAMWPSVTTRM